MTTIRHTLALIESAKEAIEGIRRLQTDIAAKAEPDQHTQPPKRKRGKAKRKERRGHRTS